ncbi:MAG: hypothetical protein Fur0043_13420 [Anaerolineales bacterium]
MPRESPVLVVYEFSGNKFTDLQSAQQYSLAETASDMLATIRALLESGALVNQNGRIIPKSQG